MECGTTTASRSRAWSRWTSRIRCGSTRPASIVRKSVGAKGLGGLSGKSIAAVARTPNLKALEEALKKGLVNAKVVPAKT